MNSLRDAFDVVDAERKQLEVYVPDDARASEIEQQFSTRNVDVSVHSLPASQGPGFLVVRDADGTFTGALGLTTFEAVLSPNTHPPWVLDDAIETESLFRFLGNSLFASYDRRQMLGTSREIEDRAWRTGSGRLYAGFQNAAAFEHQRTTYERLCTETELDVTIFVDDDWDRGSGPVPYTVVADAGDEIGRYWFVLFDGGDDERNACGLLAEERDPDEFYGFWTYDPELVDAITSYLQRTYLGQSA